MPAHRPDVVIARLRAEQEVIMSRWQEALTHLQGVATSAPLLSLVEQIAVDVVTRELDKGADALMGVVRHWADALGLDNPPELTPPAEPTGPTPPDDTPDPI